MNETASEPLDQWVAEYRRIRWRSKELMRAAQETYDDEVALINSEWRWWHRYSAAALVRRQQRILDALERHHRWINIAHREERIFLARSKVPRETPAPRQELRMCPECKAVTVCGTCASGWWAR